MVKAYTLKRGMFGLDINKRGTPAGDVKVLLLCVFLPSQSGAFYPELSSPLSAQPTPPGRSTDPGIDGACDWDDVRRLHDPVSVLSVQRERVRQLRPVTYRISRTDLDGSYPVRQGRSQDDEPVQRSAILHHIPGEYLPSSTLVA